MKRKKNRILSLVLCASIVLSGGAPMTFASAADENVAVAAQVNENGYTSETISNVRVQVLSPTVVRLEEQGPEGFEDRETFHIANRDNWEGTGVTREDVDGSVILRTSAFDITVPADAQDITGITISDKEGNLLWKYKGMPGSKVYLPDPGEEVYAWEMSDTPRMTMPEWGFTPQPAENTENVDTNGFDTNNDAPDMYVFLPQGDGVQLRKDFNKLTGQTEMLPLSALGAWDSRYYANTQDQALKQIRDYHETYQVPLDNLVIDTDWRNASSGTGYEINTTLFPNMEGFLQDANDMGVNVMFNDHPEPTKNDQGQQNSAIIPQEIQFRFGNLTNLLKMGLDGWWYDRNWHTTIVAPEGFTHEAIGASLYSYAQKAVYPNERLFMMSNVDGSSNGADIGAPDVAQHRYGITWTGDTVGHQETLQDELEFTVQYGAIAGLPYISSDIGSHMTNTDSMTADEYVKWMQYGTLSPIYRPHCSWVGSADEGRMPWLKGEDALNIIRDYVNLRYRLLPTYYNLSHENYETGMPLVRRLDFEYPEYESAARNDQYLLGEDILIAPTITDTEGGDPAVPAEWLTTPDGEPGLKAEFFNNKNLEGEPVAVKTVDNINFDWGKDSPAFGVNDDAFSIRFTGKITIGDQDVQLQTYSDDGARIFINDEMFVDSWKDQGPTALASEGILKAGETYDLRFEYYDGEYEAVCKMQYIPQGEAICTRTVWIPEGEWIDAFSGETIYGPRSIEVEAPISETPMYIRKGSVIPLADEMMTTKEKDWSHMTLDVYPSTRQSDTTTLYEDDTISNDYQEGKFRTTELSTKFVDGKVFIGIGAANGTFDGDRCFNDRSWTVRIHQPEGWGVLQSVSNGTDELSFTKVEQDTDAMPMEVEGGAADGVVYEVEVSGNVYKAMQLVATFENPVDPEVPDLDYDEPQTYEGYKQPVKRTIDVSDEMPYVVDLTSLGNLDWVQPNVNDYRETVRKDTTTPQITFLKQYARSLAGFTDYCTTFSYSDGLPIQNVEATRNGSVIFDTGASFQFTVQATEQPKQLILFIGGWKSQAKLEVFDKSADTEIDTYTFGDEEKSYYRMVTIDMTSDTGTDLVVRYTKTADGTQDGNITFAAAALRDPNAEPGEEVNKIVERTVEVTDQYPAKVNLTEEGNLDWIHLGQASTSIINRKAVEEKQLVLTNSADLIDFDDHPTAFSWTDGSPDKEATDLITGLQQSKLGSDFTLQVKAGPQEKTLKLYIGGWKGAGRLTVYDASGVTENQVYDFENMDTNFYRTVTINLKAETECTLYVRYELVAQNGGNVSFVAATLNGPEQEANVDLGLEAPETVAAGSEFEVKGTIGGLDTLESPVASLQMVMTYPEGLTCTEVVPNAVLGDTLSYSIHDGELEVNFLYISDVIDEGLPVDLDSLFTAKFTASADMAEGDYTFGLKDIVLSDWNGEDVPYTAEGASVHVTELPKEPQLLTVQWSGNASMSVEGNAEAIISTDVIYGAKVQPGEELTFTFTPTDGAFSGAQLNGEDIEFAADGCTYTFTMPGESTTLRFTFTSVDKSILGIVLEEANAVPQDVIDSLVPSAKEFFENALAKAQEVYEDAAATEEEVKEAWSDLLDAMHLLEFEAGDKETLLPLINIAEQLKEMLDQFKPGTTEGFEEALDAAKDVYAEEDALKADVDEAYDNLQAAIDKLEMRADMSILQNTVNKANGLDLNLYIDDEAMAAFKTVLAEAEELLLNADAAQADVDAKAVELSNAIGSPAEDPEQG